MADAVDLLAIYRIAVLTRQVDLRLWTLAAQGRAGFVLTGRGHEVAQVASASTLRAGLAAAGAGARNDTAWLYYRDLGVALALGVTPHEVFLGALGRGDDPHSGSRQLTAHFSSPALGIGSVSSEVGAHLPHAVGAAWAAVVQGTDAVAMCWFGDGAASEGAAHEAMNLAAVRSLPVVFVCENNGLAISVPTELQVAGSITARGASYGMPSEAIDGTDAEAVWAAAADAVDRARHGDGPSLLELAVPRIVAHSSQDDDGYRADEERAALSASDPLPRLRARCIERGVLTEADDVAFVAETEAAVAAAAKEAAAADPPDPARARRWLFAEAGGGRG